MRIRIFSLPIPALFDFTSRSCTIGSKLYFSHVLYKNNKLEYDPLEYKKYKKGNFYFIGRPIPLPVLCNGAYREKDGIYYKRNVTWWGRILNQSPTVVGGLFYYFVFQIFYNYWKPILTIGVPIIFVICAILYMIIKRYLHDETKDLHVDVEKMDDLLSNEIGETKDKEFLYLNKLVSITDEQFNNVLQFGLDENGWGGFVHIYMKNLETISDKQAEIIGKYKGGYLCLSGFSSLTDAQIESISKFKGRHLSLGDPFLKEVSLSDKQAKKLEKNHRITFYRKGQNYC